MRASTPPSLWRFADNSRPHYDPHLDFIQIVGPHLPFITKVVAVFCGVAQGQETLRIAQAIGADQAIGVHQQG